MEQAQSWPADGKHIVAQFDENSIVVYQAYNREIADYAVAHQTFGGSFSFNRMSWIKPNFLWMMFRAGWAEKENQEVILAITLRRHFFEMILSRAIHSTFLPEVYGTEARWRQLGGQSDVRMQWDPDHDPYGQPVHRKAIQLGLRGRTLHEYATEGILSIEDITSFVQANAKHVRARKLDQLIVPRESVYRPVDASVIQRIFA
ncbi:MAG: DUF4291 domain-containing protein [Leptospirales bacterium]|nr:DUF4291 domain-containing protein [Leptospirales bacterium]